MAAKRTFQGDSEGEKRQKIVLEDGEGEAQLMDVRLLISNYEASVIIGRGGSNVKSIRESCSVFMSILKSEGEAKERVLGVKGNAANIAQALHAAINLIIVDKLNKDHKESQVEATGAEPYQIKFLIHDLQTGCVIGKGGSIVKEIATETGAKVQVSTEVLAGSTEKTLTISGTNDAIHQAAIRVLQQLRDNPLKGTPPDMPYIPGRFAKPVPPFGGPAFRGGRAAPRDPYGSYGRDPYGTSPYGRDPYVEDQFMQPPYPRKPFGREPVYGQEASNTQQISIPTVCTGPVLGRGGSILTDIKNASGTQIRIADPQADQPNERIVTVTGTPQGIATALYLIRQRVDQPQQPWMGAYRLLSMR